MAGAMITVKKTLSVPSCHFLKALSQAVNPAESLLGSCNTPTREAHT